MTLKKIIFAIIFISASPLLFYKKTEVKISRDVLDENETLYKEEERFTTEVKTTRTATEENELIYEKVKRITQCTDRAFEYTAKQRGNYWVLYNYVKPLNSFSCGESITYTTHGDHTFLDNLKPLLEVWNGPVSLAIFAPGDDFLTSIDFIRYYRDCDSPLIREYVTFHIYFESEHFPNSIPPNSIFNEPFDCSFNATVKTTYRNANGLPYPINVGRNIAREMSETHFVLASDIELYPSPGLIQKFLKMVAENEELFSQSTPSIYPLAIFEIKAGEKMPHNKTQLVQMLKNNSAIPFHKSVCSYCHSMPNFSEWVELEDKGELNIFYTGERRGAFKNWEPIYIGTNAEPFYDERLTWDGKRDKMSQGYIFCVKQYAFRILDNAFLVHKSGIKVYKNDPKRNVFVSKTNSLINKYIYPELKKIFGTREGCVI